MNYSANINGIEYSVSYSDALVNSTLIPLLRHLSQMHTEKGSRVLVMLAAPPGTGKSTLVSFLEHLAKSVIPDKRVQSVGMDGFHLRQEYLLTHTVEVNGENIPMARIKGAPITFDLDALTRKIREVSEGNICRWPHYDRQIHDPVDNAITIDADIVLIEGNYFLLDADGWRDLSRFADYTIALTADEDMLRERLIGRKMKTGMTREDAEHFVAFSDMPNVRLCLEKMMKADLELSV
ncbi:MAG: nucleoside/nucleotide kinase family protein [Ruminococcus sp.]|nr:nucleoside/nucleotide kinase family protein [Ruminococcus sp.]